MFISDEVLDHNEAYIIEADVNQIAVLDLEKLRSVFNK